MKAALVVVIGMVFWLTAPAVGAAHQGEAKDRRHGNYARNQHDQRGHGNGYRQHDRHDHDRHDHRYDARHRQHRVAQRWDRHLHRQPQVRVIYRDRWIDPRVPRIVINIPL